MRCLSRLGQTAFKCMAQYGVSSLSKHHALTAENYCEIASARNGPIGSSWMAFNAGPMSNAGMKPEFAFTISSFGSRHLGAVLSAGGERPDPCDETKVAAPNALVEGTRLVWSVLQCPKCPDPLVLVAVPGRAESAGNTPGVQAQEGCV